jgi:hypothetical protein
MFEATQRQLLNRRRGPISKQRNRHLQTFGPKTRCAYQGRVALLAVFAVPLKIKISTGLNKGINQRSCQCALE